MLPLHIILRHPTTVPKSLLATLSFDALAILITILQLAQFVPQHIECYRDKSVVGVSSWLLFFGALYTYLAAVDIAITDIGPLLQCKKGVWGCFIEWQPMIQMAGCAILCGTLWWWYFLYRRNINVDDDAEKRLRNTIFYSIDGMQFLFTFLISSGIVAVLAGWIVLVYGARSRVAVEYAHWCGIASAAINMFMWVPQIITTYTYKHKGALSEYWVLFSVIMDIVYTLYLIWMGLDISIWLNNVPDGIQTAILFCMIMYYEKRDRLSGLDDFGHRLRSWRAGRKNNETIALLTKNGASPEKSYSNAV